MRKFISNILHWLGRLVKGLIGVALIPPVIGLALGIKQQLEAVPASGKSFADWVLIGAMSYLGLHLLFYKPKTVFRVHHRMLSKLSSWLFGGQVATTSSKGEPKAEKKRDTKGEKGKAASEGSQGSTLLVLSPYLVPLYTVLVCLAAWLLGRWSAFRLLDPLAGVLVGASLTMHWVMTADDLQQDRSRFPIDAYLLALAIIGLVTLLVVSACLPLAVPGFSVLGAFAEALARAGAIYSAVVTTLFF